MKVTAKDILDFLETIAPTELKMEWDNVGLLCGQKDKEVRKILVALDPFCHVCREAVAEGADLLLTHHPLIFDPLKAVTDETSTGRAIMMLLNNNIAAINAHTNLDCAEGGVNDTLAKVLDLADVKIIGNEHLLRSGNFESDLPAFLSHVKAKLGCEGLRYVDGGKPVCKVAVGGGSCADEMMATLRAGCDTFVTSDIKYNQFWDAYDLGLNMIDAGHFYTENPVVSMLAEKIAAAFPEIEVKISETHGDCTKYY